MTLLQALAAGINHEIDRNGGRAPSEVCLHSTLRKVLLDDLNKVRKQLGQDDLGEEETIYVRAVPVIADDEREPWGFV